MRIRYIEEPLLEFGNNYHIDPRTGIANYSVYDTKFKVRRNEIIIGGVGTTQNLASLNEWLLYCSDKIPAKDSSQPNLFTEFCGFNQETGFHTNFVFDDETTRIIKESDVRRIIKIKNWNKRVEEAVELYYRQVKFIAQNRVADVIICILPMELHDAIATREIKPVEETLEGNQEDDLLEVNFRRLLKARTMHLGIPIQLSRALSLEKNAKTQQDDATKAWNFCTGLYYKANKTVPWKLAENNNTPKTCYIGIGFYRSRDKQILNTSLAQVFDELGNSVILRGTPVEIDKNDRRPHLSAEQSENLLIRALEEYEIALGNMPARLVIHKSSNYNHDELEGFQSAAQSMRVGTTDFVTFLDTDMRLLREGSYPTYRGMHVEFNSETHLLYTRGFVPFYETYRGSYIPQPLEVRIVESDISPDQICDEILSLTKMNWNNTDFDGKFPITIQCARRVGQIMKYLDENDRPQISYSYYM